MRHPGMQYLDRLEKTAAKYASTRGDYIECLGNVLRLKNELSQAQDALGRAKFANNEVRGVMIRLLDAEGLTSYGLPGDISREEFEEKIRKID